MNYIETVNNKKFTLNGQLYLRKFFSDVKGDKIRIYNAYDSRNVILDYVRFSQITVNGIAPDTVENVQSYLLDAIFTAGNGEDANFPDALISGFDGITIVNGVLTVPANCVWRIGGQIFSNPLPFTVNIPPATDGFFRTDLLQANQLNSFELKIGTESNTAVPAPTPDGGKIAVIPVNVFGADISNPEIPIEGSAYITKLSKGLVSTNLTSNNNLVMQPRLRYELNTAVAFIKGMVDISQSLTQTALLFDGQELTISFNHANTSTALYHLDGTLGANGFKFEFPLGQNYIARPNEMIVFTLNLANKTWKFKSSNLDAPTIQRQFIINGDTTLNNTHNNAMLLVKSDSVVSVPAGLIKAFNCVFRTYDANLQVIISVGSGITLDAPTGNILTAKKMSTLVREASTNFYFYHGETSLS